MYQKHIIQIRVITIYGKLLYNDLYFEFNWESIRNISNIKKFYREFKDPNNKHKHVYNINIFLQTVYLQPFFSLNTRFSPPKQETFFKDDANHDPQWSDEQIVSAKFQLNGLMIGNIATKFFK